MGEADEVVVPFVNIGTGNGVSYGGEVAGVLHQFHSYSVGILRKNIHEDDLENVFVG